MGSRLYVGNLPFSASDVQLKSFLEEGGYQVSSVRIITDRETGRSRGFAFVDMTTSEDAQALIKNFNGREFQGRALTINEARERQPHTGGGGDRRSGGYRNGGAQNDSYTPNFSEDPGNYYDPTESRAQKFDGRGRGRNDRGGRGKGGYDRDRGFDRGGRGGKRSRGGRFSYEEDDDDY